MFYFDMKRINSLAPNVCAMICFVVFIQSKEKGYTFNIGSVMWLSERIVKHHSAFAKVIGCTSAQHTDVKSRPINYEESSFNLMIIVSCSL